MHPAFSVIFFTTLSGAGCGLLFWLGLLVAAGQAMRQPWLVIVSAVLAGILIGAGLLSSMAHLGRPERAWLALSQWRSSWLSREGIAAIATFAPMAALVAGAWLGWPRAALLTAALAGSAMAVVTTLCTSRIYDTLKPVPAWTSRWVLANYLLLAAASGAAWLWAIGVLGFSLPTHRGDGLILVALLAIAAAGKVAYWRRIDRLEPRKFAPEAIGLAADARVTPFEAPHTQANFLMKEMGYALARKHGRRLRRIALVLIVLLPVCVLLPAMLRPELRPLAAIVTVASVMAGVLVERWLFFAQARHMVMTYYDAAPT
jgi:DMSO reductase anchor subunit